MAFGTISVLYIPSTFTTAAVGGTRIAKLVDVADAATNTSTTTLHPSNSTSRRFTDPYLTGTNANVGPDSTRGYAVTVADMNSVAGALRFYPAGTHTAIFYASGGSTAGNNTYYLLAYRVGPSPTFTKTLLGSASATGSGLGATVSIPLSLGQIVLAAGETIEYEIDGETNPGVVTGTITYSFGTSSAITGSVVSRITTPELGILASSYGTSVGVATVAGAATPVIGSPGSAAGSAVVDGNFSAVASFVGNATGSATAAGQLSATASFVGTAAGSAAAAGSSSSVIGSFGTATVGGGGGTTIVRRSTLVFED